MCGWTGRHHTAVRPSGCHSSRHRDAVKHDAPQEHPVSENTGTFVFKFYYSFHIKIRRVYPTETSGPGHSPSELRIRQRLASQPNRCFNRLPGGKKRNTHTVTGFVSHRNDRRQSQGTVWCRAGRDFTAGNG